MAAADADDVAPPTASGYLDPSYWDERFGKEEHYEWFKDFSHFRHLLAPLLSPSLSVLEVGCGNSRLGEELLREGVAGGITCVDLSPVAVQRMRDRLAAQGTKGEFPDISLPFLTDKKRCFDALWLVTLPMATIMVVASCRCGCCGG
jgi:SAM-dependent methyltransferase